MKTIFALFISILVLGAHPAHAHESEPVNCVEDEIWTCTIRCMTFPNPGYRDIEFVYTREASSRAAGIRAVMKDAAKETDYYTDCMERIRAGKVVCKKL